MYQKIQNPKTNKWISIYSNQGKSLIQKYVHLMGGSRPQQSYLSNIYRSIQEAHMLGILNETDFQSYVESLKERPYFKNVKSIHNDLIKLHANYNNPDKKRLTGNEKSDVPSAEEKKITWKDTYEIHYIEPYYHETIDTSHSEAERNLAYSENCSYGMYSELCPSMEFPCLVSSESSATSSDTDSIDSSNSYISENDIDSKCYNRDGDTWVVPTYDLKW